MTMLAQKLNYDREVIRVWFCNKRQALKNTLKKLKQGDGGGGMDSSDHSDAESSLNTSLPSVSTISNSVAASQSAPQQIMVSQPQVISVVASQSGQQTVAATLDSATNSNATELTVIKQVSSFPLLSVSFCPFLSNPCPHPSNLNSI